MRRPWALLGLITTLLSLSACRIPISFWAGQGEDQRRPLQIWWSRGYYPEETDAIEMIAREWQRASGQAVQLRLFSQREIWARTEAIRRGAQPPDILYGYGINESAALRLASRGQLVEVEDVIAPIRNELLPGVFESVVYLNRRTGKRAAYAVPVSRHSVNIHFWRDLLAEQLPASVHSPRASQAEASGATASGASVSGATVSGAEAIPSDWRGFWNFWDQQQRRLQALGYTNIYALGLPMSSRSNDTSIVFEYFLDAYNVKVYDRAGNLTLRQHRDGLIRALEDYASHYRRHSVPPASLKWIEADNNIDFLSSHTLMTINPTLSIPGALIADDIAYLERLGSLPWPSKPDGSPLASILYVQQLVLFDRGKVKTAKAFVGFLLKPSNLSRFVEGSLGRFLPVTRQIDAMPFWQDPDDPHIRLARANLRRARLPTVLLNPAYSDVMSRNVWSTAIERIASGKTTAVQAADQAIGAIETIDRRWR